MCPPGRQTRTWADELFAELRRVVSKQDKRSACHNLCISAETWILVDERVSTRSEPGRYQQRLRQLGRAIWDSLKEYRQHRVTKSGEAVESLLTGYPPLPCEAWRRMRGWYQEAVDHAPLPARVTLERIMVECEELYCVVPSWGRLFPYPCCPPQLTTPYLQRRRSSGR